MLSKEIHTNWKILVGRLLSALKADGNMLQSSSIWLTKHVGVSAPTCTSQCLGQVKHQFSCAHEAELTIQSFAQDWPLPFKLPVCTSLYYNAAAVDCCKVGLECNVPRFHMQASSHAFKSTTTSVESGKARPV